MKPARISSYDDALSRIRDWEAATRLYLKEFPEERVSDSEKGNILKDMVPEDLRNDLIKMEKRGFQSIYDYVTTQVPLRREEDMRKRGKKYPLNSVTDDQAAQAPTQPTPSQGSDELNSLIRNGGRVGGGQAQKPSLGLTGAFSGDCHYCKVTGHRSSDCEKRKTDIAKGIWAPAGDEPRPYLTDGPPKGQGGGQGQKGMGFRKGGGKGFGSGGFERSGGKGGGAYWLDDAQA